MGMDDDSVAGLQSAKLCGEAIPNMDMKFCRPVVIKDPFFDKNKPEGGACRRVPSTRPSVFLGS